MATTLDRSATSELDEYLRASKALRRKHEPQWLLNLSYYDGRQWVAYNGREVFEPQLEDWRAKIVDNRIRGIIRTEIAKMTKSRPKWVGVPRTSDDEDIASARLAERALDYQWEALRLTHRLRSALLWARICGAGFWKVWWDPGKGDSTEILVYGGDHERAGEPIRTAEGGVYKASDTGRVPEGIPVEPRTLRMGDVCVDLRSPFEMFPDPLAGEEGLDSAEWVIEEAVYPKHFLAARFPNADIDALDEDGDPSGVENALPGPKVIEDRGAPGYRGVKVREYWCRPGSLHPRGKRAVWAQERLLFEEDNPYPWLPHVMFTGIPVPGRFWPGAITTDLISPQTELNKVKSQIAENGERFGNPTLLLSAANAGETLDQMDGSPGGTAIFEDMGTPGSIPAFLVPPGMPAFVENEIERAQESIREISGQHEVTSGTVPAGVTAASAINLLQEQDDTRLGPDVGDMEQTVAEAGKRLIYLMAREYTDKRTIRIAGEDSEWDIQAFKGTELKGQQDIQVQAGSGIPQSKAAKQAAIQSILTLFVQNAVPLSERDLRRMLNEYEVGGLEALFADVSRDERQVKDENRRMLLGQPLEINSYDTDALHIAGHEDFQKTSRYAQLAQTPQGKAIQTIFEAHVEAHRMRQAQQQLAQATPPPAPPAPPAQGGPQAQNGGAPPTMPAPA